MKVVQKERIWIRNEALGEERATKAKQMRSRSATKQFCFFVLFFLSFPGKKSAMPTCNKNHTSYITHKSRHSPSCCFEDD